MKIYRIKYEAFDTHYHEERWEFETYVPAVCEETAKAHWEKEIASDTEWSRHKLLKVSEVNVPGHRIRLEEIVE